MSLSKQDRKFLKTLADNEWLLDEDETEVVEAKPTIKKKGGSTARSGVVCKVDWKPEEMPSLDELQRREIIITNNDILKCIENKNSLAFINPVCEALNSTFMRQYPKLSFRSCIANENYIWFAGYKFQAPPHIKLLISKWLTGKDIGPASFRLSQIKEE